MLRNMSRIARSHLLSLACSDRYILFIYLISCIRLQAEFEQIAADVQKVKTRPTDQELLDLYGLFKQANVGDVNTGKISCRGTC